MCCSLSKFYYLNHSPVPANASTKAKENELLVFGPTYRCRKTPTATPLFFRYAPAPVYASHPEPGRHGSLTQGFCSFESIPAHPCRFANAPSGLFTLPPTPIARRRPRLAQRGTEVQKILRIRSRIVGQGGKSWGKSRQGQPLLKT